MNGYLLMRKFRPYAIDQIQDYWKLYKGDATDDKGSTLERVMSGTKNL